MPMTNDSSNLTFLEESEKTKKSPSEYSINIIRQFARVYSIPKGRPLSKCILN